MSRETASMKPVNEMTPEEAAKYIREPMDCYSHGPQETERWYAAVEEVERRAKKAIEVALSAKSPPEGCVVWRGEVREVDYHRTVDGKGPPQCVGTSILENGETVLVLSPKGPANG